jgi:peroxiredoxin Q/BCP
MFMGKKFKGVIRSTFIIDKNKRILKTWKSVKVKEHAKEVLDYLKSI